jgi:hypothetical protein
VSYRHPRRGQDGKLERRGAIPPIQRTGGIPRDCAARSSGAFGEVEAGVGGDVADIVGLFSPSFFPLSLLGIEAAILSVLRVLLFPFGYLLDKELTLHLLADGTTTSRRMTGGIKSY